MTRYTRCLMLLTCSLIIFSRLAGAQVADAPRSNDMPGFSEGPQGAVPDTPEQPQNDIHVESSPEVHPDIIEGSAEVPPPPSYPGIPGGNNDVPVGDLSPVEPDNVLPPPEGQPIVAPVDTSLDTSTSKAVPPVEPPLADAGSPREGPAAEQVAAPAIPEEDKGPFNPWRVPSPGQPAVELQAGSSFNFSWTSNTEGLVNLELWKIENNTPVPKFLLASDKPNDGTFVWKILGNFPHGTGYCLVIVPPDRNHASLSPLFTVLGNADYDMPVPAETNHQPTLDSLEVSLVGTQKKMLVAVGVGFLLCNVVAALAWFANDRESSRSNSHAQYSTQQRGSGKRVFHARMPSNPR